MSNVFLQVLFRSRHAYCFQGWVAFLCVYFDIRARVSLLVRRGVLLPVSKRGLVPSLVPVTAWKVVTAAKNTHSNIRIGIGMYRCQPLGTDCSSAWPIDAWSAPSVLGCPSFQKTDLHIIGTFRIVIVCALQCGGKGQDLSMHSKVKC